MIVNSTKDRIMILNRTQAEMGDYGLDSSGLEWEETGCVWANVTWTKGVRSLQVGAIDAYGVIEVRMRFVMLLKKQILSGGGCFLLF